jgi:hypothetical protein
MPFQAVEDSGEGIGKDIVIMDEFAIWPAGAIGDAPMEMFSRAGEDLTDTTAVLKADFIGGGGVNEAAGFNNGEETPADLGFFLGGEFDRDDTGGEGTIKHGPEAFAHAGGVDDDVLRRSLLCQVLDLTEDGEVIFTGPGVTGEDAIGWTGEGGEGGEVDADDGEGGGVTAGVAEAFAEEGGGKAGIGFIHAGNVEEEGTGTGDGRRETGSGRRSRGAEEWRQRTGQMTGL